MISGRGGGSLTAGKTTVSSPGSSDSACLKSALALPDTALYRDGEARLKTLMEYPRLRARPRAGAAIDLDTSVLFAAMKGTASSRLAAPHAQQGPAQ